MKTTLLLGSLLPMLPASVRDLVNKLAKDEGRAVDDLTLRRVGHSEKVAAENLDEGSRSAIKYVGARTVDRDNEIVVPKGMDLSAFKKYMHVLWGHNYALPPIGSNEYIEADDFGIKAKTVYADTGEGTLSNILWHLVSQGHQKASSIGFVPLAWTQPDHNDWDKTVKTLAGMWPEFAKRTSDPSRIITKGALLEHSDVSVPANPDAEVVSVAKSFGADSVVLKHLGFDCEPPKADPPNDPPAEDKGVVAYRQFAKSSKTASWNGPREVAAADLPGLKLMATWYDAEHADMKGAYKLPHHKASAGHQLVWRGLTAAMGALLGARGGVDLPTDDRAGVYAHLSRHYAEYDAKPPELRDYTQGELKGVFPELYEVVRVIKAAAPRIVRVVSLPNVSPVTNETLVRQAIHDELDRRRGIVR